MTETNGDSLPAETADESAAVPDRISEIGLGIVAKADARALFGESTAVGDSVVIPAASVTVMTGFGMGSGSSGGDEAGGGGGGGASIKARPVAVIHATAEDITVEPVIDFAQIALASIATALFLIVWIARLARGAGDGETSPSIVGQIKRVIG